MIREEAIEILKHLIPIPRRGDSESTTHLLQTNALAMAIKELEQEPKNVLDKMRAEIMKLDDINPDYPMDRTIHISRNEVLQIIDRYRNEVRE